MSNFKLLLRVHRNANKLSGTVNYLRDEISAVAKNEEELKQKMRENLKPYGIKEYDFETVYRLELRELFERCFYLNQSQFAKIASINAGLLRQYASGKKTPSPTQVKKIESAIQKVIQDLQNVCLT